MVVRNAIYSQLLKHLTELAASLTKSRRRRKTAFGNKRLGYNYLFFLFRTSYIANHIFERKSMPKDARVAKLADVLVSHSTKLQPGENVLIETFDAPDEILTALVERVHQAGATPFVETRSNKVLRALYTNGTEAQMQAIGEHELGRMKNMQAYIAVRGSHNALELSDVPADKMKTFQKEWWKPVTDWRVNKTKWVVLRYPSPAFAQAAGMSTEAFEDFYFNVCTLDYAKMGEAQKPLHHQMGRANKE